MPVPIKILHYPGQMSTFNSDWLQILVGTLFEFEPYDPAAGYPAGTLFYTNCVTTTPAQLAHVQSRDFRIVYDNLWEQKTQHVPDVLVLHNPAWFWYNESLWYHHLGYTNYHPDRTYEFLALMPMNLAKTHRTRMKQQLGATLDRMIWSYVAEGRQLPWDKDMSVWNTQRYVNPEWYNQSYCSIVSETAVEPAPYQSVFITEKTFKPIAFRHPFLIHAQQYSLQAVRDMGFVTWDNLWDESYDSLADANSRCDAVVKIVQQIDVSPYDSETRYRINHNAQHFFNRNLVLGRMREEIINPIIHYAETR